MHALRNTKKLFMAGQFRKFVVKPNHALKALIQVIQADAAFAAGLNSGVTL